MKIILWIALFVLASWFLSFGPASPAWLPYGVFALLTGTLVLAAFDLEALVKVQV